MKSDPGFAIIKSLTGSGSIFSGNPRSLGGDLRDIKNFRGLASDPGLGCDRMLRLMLAEERSLIQQRNAIEERAAQLFTAHPT